jgi:hypothetical protein
MAHASVKRIEAVLEPMFTSAISIPTLKPDHREDYAQAWSSNRRPPLYEEGPCVKWLRSCIARSGRAR